MAAISLETLVLRVLSVLRGGKVHNPRLGASADAVGLPATASDNSMRHPRPACRQDYPQPADELDPVVSNPVDEERVAGAGRSHGAGVHRRSFPAIHAGRTVRNGRFESRSRNSVLKRSGRLAAKRVGKRIAGQRLSHGLKQFDTAGVFISTPLANAGTGSRWRKPAGGTPSTATTCGTRGR